MRGISIGTLFTCCCAWLLTASAALSAVEPVNESVLSAINERRIFMGQAPIVWPNNAAGVAPGDFPASGHYKDDPVGVSGSLFSQSVIETNAVLSSFVYFANDTLPELHVAENFRPAPNVTGAATWNELVTALQKSKFQSHTVGWQVQERNSGWGGPFRIDYEDALIVVLESAYSHLSDYTYTDRPNATAPGAYTSVYGNTSINYNPLYYPIPSAYGKQFRLRMRALPNPTRDGLPLTVYIQGFDPGTQFINPQLVPSDGQYHRKWTLSIPSDGDWIEAGQPVQTPLNKVWENPDRLRINATWYAFTYRNGTFPIGYIEKTFQYPGAGSGGEPDVPSIDKPEAPSHCDCPEDPNATDQSPNKKCPEDGATSKANSLIDNIRLTYRHIADDFETPDVLGGCSSCGGLSPDMGRLPSLSLRRLHRYDLIGAPSSFGPGVFLGTDISLLVHSPLILDVINPQSATTSRLVRAASGAPWTNVTHNLTSSFSIDGSGDPVAGALATYTTRAGRTFRFTFVDDGAGKLRARLTSLVDRNGHGVTIQYLHQATASTADLGGDRAALWRLTSLVDSYGQSAMVQYAAASVAGHPVISRIDLPQGGFNTYRYEQPSLGFANQDLVGFSGATLANGDAVTVTATIDAGRVKIYFDDSAANGTHRRKTVWLTAPTMVDPRDNLPMPYRIIQVLQGEGEISYRNRLEADGINWISLIQDGASLIRLTHTTAGRLIRSDRAMTWDWDQPTSTYTWETSGVYEWDSQIRATGWTDSLNRVTTSIPDTATNAPARIDYPDGTFATTTYNAFSQPLLHVDRLGRQTSQTYDAQGNLLTRTEGFASPVAATTSYTYWSAVDVAIDGHGLAGQVRTMTDAAGSVTDYAYWPDGHLHTVTHPADVAGGPRAVETFTWDGAGRLASSSDPVGRTVTYAYDSRNRVETRTYTDGSHEHITYGSGAEANLVVAETDRNGNVTRYAYDGAGRRIVSTRGADTPDAITETCTYLPGTTLETVCVNAGERRSTTYDYRQRPSTTTVQPRVGVALTSANTYDSAQRLVKRTDPYGRATWLVYDVNDRQVVSVQPPELAM